MLVELFLDCPKRKFAKPLFRSAHCRPTICRSPVEATDMVQFGGRKCAQPLDKQWKVGASRALESNQTSAPIRLDDHKLANMSVG